MKSQSEPHQVRKQTQMKVGQEQESFRSGVIKTVGKMEKSRGGLGHHRGQCKVRSKDKGIASVMSGSRV